MMSRHNANHIKVVYGNDELFASKACGINVAELGELDIKVHFCREVPFQ